MACSVQQPEMHLRDWHVPISTNVHIKLSYMALINTLFQMDLHWCSHVT